MNGKLITLKKSNVENLPSMLTHLNSNINRKVITGLKETTDGTEESLGSARRLNTGGSMVSIHGNNFTSMNSDFQHSI